MAIVGDTLPHCTGTGTQADPYIFEDVYGFAEAIGVVDAYVEAKTSNMQWDCNNDIYALPCPITFKCLELRAKGFTIINPVVQNQDISVFYFLRTTRENTQKIYNLNAYNVCIINYGYAHSLISDSAQYGESHGGAGITELYNCNFAGVSIGYGGEAFIGHSGYTWKYDTMQYHFYSCTFNFNLSDPTNTAGAFYFHISSIGYYDTSYLHLSNCVISFSGSRNGAFVIDGTFANTTTFTNSQANPLNCNEIRVILSSNPALSGYNYHKMSVTANSGTLTDSLGLWNTSRYHITTPTYTGIQMQETDSTLSTYIYDDANLENAGFFVGQVIT